jgi:hypothetical protein
MPEYSIEEYADMYFVDGEYSGKATAAVRRYSNACIRANGGHFEHLFFFSHIISQLQNFLSEIFLLMNENIHK